MFRITHLPVRGVVLMLAVAIVCASLLVAAVPGPAQAKERVVRVSGWGGTDIAIVEELIDRFVKPQVAKEGIVVKYEPVADEFSTYLMNSLSAGTAPDLFYVDIYWSHGVFASGAVEPLDSYLAKSRVLKARDIVPDLLKAFTLNGKIYGIPKDFNTLALFYNKDLFDAAHVPYPNANDNWNTLTEKLRKVTNKSKGIYGIALTPEFARFGAFAYAAGFKPFDAQGHTDLSQPAFADAFKWYTGLVREGIGVLPADLGQSWGGGAFATEKVACAVEGAWMLGFLRDQAPNLPYGVTLLPKNPKTGKRGNIIYTVSWSMNAASKDKDAAFRVLEALTSPEAQQWILERGLALPSRAKLANNPYFQKGTPEAQANKIVFAGASDGYVYPFSFGKYGGDWMTPINEALAAVMSGKATADQVLPDLTARLRQLTK